MRLILEEAAEHGSVDALLSLGCMYMDGLGVEQDHAVARYYFERVAVSFSHQSAKGRALVNLGWLYQQGYGMEQNFERSRRYYEEAAQFCDDVEGHEPFYAYAFNNLGFFCQHGYGGELDGARAKTLYERAARGFGDSDGLVNLGILYQHGTSDSAVHRDYALAKNCFEQAAEKDDPHALNNLGWLYQSGLGVPVDYQRAKAYYDQAAASGDKDAAGSALRNLGLLHEHGLGLPRDVPAARRLYTEAAEHGSAAAYVQLGLLCDEAHDEHRARLHYAKAQELGDGYSMFRYGEDAAAGHGVPANARRAQRFFELAVNLGYNNALDRVKPHLSNTPLVRLANIAAMPKQNPHGDLVKNLAAAAGVVTLATLLAVRLVRVMRSSGL